MGGECSICTKHPRTFHAACASSRQEENTTRLFCGQGRLRALKWAERHVCMDLNMNNVFLDLPLALHRSEPTPAIPITIWMLCMLELYCVNPVKPMVMRVYAAGIIICCYACLRFAQAQDCYFSELHAGAMFSGFVYREKAANPSKRVSRPFWGLTSSRYGSAQ